MKIRNGCQHIVAVILTALLLMGVMPIAAFATSNITVTIDTYVSVTLKDTNGNGYYEIGTADELYAFAAAVNEGYYAICGELTDDIVINENVLNEDGTVNGTPSRIWTPIGNDTNAYTGTFDGNGYSVSGLYYNDDNGYCVGLFGSVLGNGTVKNVGVIDSYLNGYRYIGGVAGSNLGSVTNCNNTGEVGGSYYVGGVAGENYGAIENCYNECSVSGDNNVGGVVGYNNYILTDCCNTGEVTGNRYVGGVAGYNDNDTGIVTNCYYMDTAATGGINSADVIGQAEAVTESQFASGQIAYLLGDGFGQNLDNGDTVQTIPVLGGAKVYYGYISCGNIEMVYTNGKNASAEKPDHTEVIDKAIDPTCTEQGYTIYVCSACGYNYTEVFPALGHNYSSKVTEPTCTEQGYTTYTCTCGDSYVADFVNATGHAYKDGTCTLCGDVLLGDLNYDAIVDLLDLSEFAVALANSELPEASIADMNGDGIVDLLDYSDLAVSLAG